MLEVGVGPFAGTTQPGVGPVGVLLGFRLVATFTAWAGFEQVTFAGDVSFEQVAFTTPVPEAVKPFYAANTGELEG